MTRKQLEYWKNHRKIDEMKWHHIPCVIFKDYDMPGEIVLSRCDDPRFVKGANFWKLAQINSQQRPKVRDAIKHNHAIWLPSAMGVGVLCSSLYDLCGVLIYFHVHDDICVGGALCWAECSNGVIAPFPFNRQYLKPPSEYKFDNYTGHIQALKNLQFIKQSLHLLSASPLMQKMPYLIFQDYLHNLSELVGIQLITPDIYTIHAGTDVYDMGLLRYLYLRWFFVLKKLCQDNPLKISIYQSLQAQLSFRPTVDTVSFRAKCANLSYDEWDELYPEIKELLNWSRIRNIYITFDMQKDEIILDFSLATIGAPRPDEDFRSSLNISLEGFFDEDV